MTLKDKLEVEIMDLTIMDEVIDDIGKTLNMSRTTSRLDSPNG
jgi:hypothetical protein